MTGASGANSERTLLKDRAYDELKHAVKLCFF